MNKFWIVVVVLVVIAGAFWVLKGGSSMSTPETAVNTSPKTVAVSSPVHTATPKAVVSSKPTSTPALSYTQATQVYKNRTIQFNDSCQATPKSFVLKNGSSILIDNRSSSAHVVTVDGTSYPLTAWGFQVVTLSSATLPHMVKLNCGSSVNVSTIMLQADISGQ